MPATKYSVSKQRLGRTKLAWHLCKILNLQEESNAMNTKKVLATVLALMLALSLFACGGTPP